MIGGVTHGSLDLFVPSVADEKNVVILARKTNGLAVDFGHQGAGGINGVKPAVGRLSDDHRRDAVGGENNGRRLRHFGDFIDKDDASGFEFLHDVDVVNNLLAHIHRGTKALERLLDGNNRTVNPGAISPGSCQKNALVARHWQIN